MHKYKPYAVLSEGIDDSINCLDFSPDGQLLAIGTHNHKTHIYDFKNKFRVLTLVGASSVTSVLWHRNSDTLFVGFAAGDTFAYHYMASIIDHARDDSDNVRHAPLLHMPLLTATLKSSLQSKGYKMPYESRGPVEGFALDPVSHRLAILTGPIVVLIVLDSSGELEFFDCTAKANSSLSS